MIPEEVVNTVSLEFSAMARTKSMSGEKLYSLGLGEPFWQAPQSVREKLSELALNAHFGYKSPFGNPELRGHIAQALTSISDFEIESGNVLIAAGAKQALSIALKTILEDEDEVIILDPCFVSYRPQVLLANHNAKALSCPLSDDFTIDFSALTSQITDKTKAILVNTPNNPSGGLISKAEMDSLVQLAQNCGAYLICDEIYRDFVFYDARFHSANAHRGTYDQIITIDGFSKTYGMTGWRLGYLVASQEFISKAVKVVQHEMTNIPELLQVAACEVFSLPGNWFEQYRSVLERNAAYYFETTKDISVLQTAQIQAGMFCFPSFDLKGVGSDQIAVELLKDQSVAVTPGVAFGKRWDDYIRISLSSPETEFRDAIDRFAHFFRKF
ncbi:pyridoxal phosphate-dependent aminotransferase [Thalassospira alkalitolerans]|uniref:pyridoxal phosphate-dependent aminotransferase n=1 Tax=Thalassospira alkalitolerans TaxID=1293890 RepID=UPI003AA9C8DC